MALTNGCNSCFLLVVFVATSCKVTEAVPVHTDQRWLIVIVPIIVSIGITIVICVCCLRKRCQNEDDQDFSKMASTSISSTSFSSHNSASHHAISTKGLDPYRSLSSCEDKFFIDISDKNGPDTMNDINGIQNFRLGNNTNSSPSEHRELSLEMSCEAKYSVNGKRHSPDPRKKNDLSGFTKVELTLDQLKILAADVVANGTVREESSDNVFAPEVVNSGCKTVGNSGPGSEHRLRDTPRTMSAASETDYDDLDDNEVQKSIEREKHSKDYFSDAMEDNALKPLKRNKSLRRPLPEISEPLEIVIDNDFYSSL